MTDNTLTDAGPKLSKAPRAGLVEPFPSGQITYLAPMPLPTELPADDYSHAVGEVNDTYMDFGVGSSSVFFWQMGIGVPLFYVFLFSVFGPLLLLLVGIAGGNEFQRVLDLALMLFLESLDVSGAAVTFSIAVFLFVFFKNLGECHYILPTRFNRQRREVCFVPEGKTEPIFVPWESLSAWVVESRGLTQYGTTMHYGMGVGFYHPPDNQHYSLEFQCAGFDLAVCNWEAIRAYMEYEVHTLKDIQDPLDLQNPGDPPHEGVHTFYNARERMRRRRRNKEVGFFYPFWWYLYHVMTLWTLPNYLTEWQIRKIKSIGKAVIPKDMQAWSEPLPPEQWAKPSESLLRQSAAARALNKEHPDLPIAVRFQAAQLADSQPASAATR